jgi:NADH-quinone oxidoreductase subunit J
MGLAALGTALFRDHLVAFEAAGLLLLAAMVGAVALVKRDL